MEPVLVSWLSLSLPTDCLALSPVTSQFFFHTTHRVFVANVRLTKQFRSRNTSVQLVIQFSVIYQCCANNRNFELNRIVTSVFDYLKFLNTYRQ